MTFRLGLFITVFIGGTNQLANGVEIDNGVIGHPEVSCGAQSIRIDVSTKQEFEGRIYVKGESEVKGCFTQLSAGGQYGVAPSVVPPNSVGYGKKTVVVKRQVYGYQPAPEVQRSGTGAFFELPLGHCNMRRARTLQPRGVEYFYTVVVSFHPFFITKVDKAYRVKCFYMEAQKTVASDLQVSMLTTAGLEQQFPMPVCQYFIRSGGYDGSPVRYAKVGDKVVHVWQCSQETQSIYGMLVKSCYVDNGHGKKFQIIDDKGCPVDIHLVPSIEYSQKELQASVKSHIFKFADLPQLYFTCTIQLCVKDLGGCQGLTPPNCGYKTQAGQTSVFAGGNPSIDYQSTQPSAGYPGPGQLQGSGPYGAVSGHRMNLEDAGRNPDYKQIPDEVNEAIAGLPPLPDLSVLDGYDVKSQKQRRSTGERITGIANSTDIVTDRTSNLMEADVTSQPVVVLPFDDEEIGDSADDLFGLTVERTVSIKETCMTTTTFTLVVLALVILLLASCLFAVLYTRRAMMRKIVH